MGKEGKRMNKEDRFAADRKEIERIVREIKRVEIEGEGKAGGGRETGGEGEGTDRGGDRKQKRKGRG